MKSGAQQIYLSREFFSSLENKTDLVAITNNKLTNLIRIKNKNYCLSGAVGTGTGVGWASMYAYEAVPIINYSNEKEPLNYNKHFDEVRNEKRERSYDGLLLDHNGEKYVLVGPEVELKPLSLPVTVQQSIF